MNEEKQATNLTVENFLNDYYKNESSVVNLADALNITVDEMRNMQPEEFISKVRDAQDARLLRVDMDEFYNMPPDERDYNLEMVKEHGNGAGGIAESFQWETEALIQSLEEALEADISLNQGISEDKQKFSLYETIDGNLNLFVQDNDENNIVYAHDYKEHSKDVVPAIKAIQGGEDVKTWERHDAALAETFFENEGQLVANETGMFPNAMHESALEAFDLTLDDFVAYENAINQRIGADGIIHELIEYLNTLAEKFKNLTHEEGYRLRDDLAYEQHGISWEEYFEFANAYDEYLNTPEMQAFRQESMDIQATEYDSATIDEPTEDSPTPTDDEYLSRIKLGELFEDDYDETEAGIDADINQFPDLSAFKKDPIETWYVKLPKTARDTAELMGVPFVNYDELKAEIHKRTHESEFADLVMELDDDLLGKMFDEYDETGEFSLFYTIGLISDRRMDLEYQLRMGEKYHPISDKISIIDSIYKYMDAWGGAENASKILRISVDEYESERAFRPLREQFKKNTGMDSEAFRKAINSSLNADGVVNTALAAEKLRISEDRFIEVEKIYKNVGLDTAPSPPSPGSSSPHREINPGPAQETPADIKIDEWAGIGTDINQAPNVKELFTILEENNKPEQAAALKGILNHVTSMEKQVAACEKQISEMKTQLESTPQIQENPLREQLEKLIESLEKDTKETKGFCGRIKDGIANGCKNAIEAVKEKGIEAVDKMASFFGVREHYEKIEAREQKAIDRCEKAIEKIEAFSSEYHKAGNALKNVGRMLVGKEPLERSSEMGKLANAMCAPYRNSINYHTEIKDSASASIAKLDKLSERAEAIQEKRTEKKAAKSAPKPKKNISFDERLNKAKNVANREQKDKQPPQIDKTRNKSGNEEI
jgi:regulator of replication initiation timing